MIFLYQINKRLILYWAWFDGWIGYQYNLGSGILYLSIIPTFILAVIIDLQKVEDFEKEYFS